jgi:hypothetical protein
MIGILQRRPGTIIKHASGMAGKHGRGERMLLGGTTRRDGIDSANGRARAAHTRAVWRRIQFPAISVLLSMTVLMYSAISQPLRSKYLTTFRPDLYAAVFRSFETRAEQKSV